MHAEGHTACSGVTHMPEPICTPRQNSVAMMSCKLVICSIPAFPAAQPAPFEAFVEGPGRRAASHHDACRLSQHPGVSRCHCCTAGNWYNWGQQPTAYVPAFQRITNAVRQVRMPAGHGSLAQCREVSKTGLLRPVIGHNSQERSGHGNLSLLPAAKSSTGGVFPKGSSMPALVPLPAVHLLHLLHLQLWASHITATMLLLRLKSPGPCVQYTCRTFMLWAPNNGGGYPFPNGTAIADYLSAPDFKAMDTNGDGQITQTDDPYAPFYPVSIACTSQQPSMHLQWDLGVLTGLVGLGPMRVGRGGFPAMLALTIKECSWRQLGQAVW